MSDAAPDTVTALILEVFRANGALLAAGDRLVAGIGLTSARWQVLGAVALAAGALPVAGIARTMGLTRQGVQRTVDELARQGLVTFAENPHHRRAKRVVLTAAGEAAYAAASARQAPWATELGRGLDPAALAEATRILRTLGARASTDRTNAAEPPDDHR